MTPEERAKEKLEKLKAQKIKDKMTIKQLIDFVNAPYADLPDYLKVGMTRRPQKFNFVKMKHPNIGDQQETFAARLIRYRSRYHMSVEEFAAFANEFAKNYGTKVTKRDIANYENYNVCPKIDKMTAISEAMGVEIDYFAGYGASVRKSRNELIELRRSKSAPLSISYRSEMAQRKGVRGLKYGHYEDADISSTIAAKPEIA